MTTQQPQHTRKSAPTPADINRAQGFEPPKSRTEATRTVAPVKPPAPPTKAVAPAPGTAVAAASSTALTSVASQEAFERNLSLWGRGGETPLGHNGLEGGFRTTGGEEVDVSETIFVAHLNQTRRGWIKFNGEGNQPDIISVGIYEDAVLPAREELGDNDETLWETDRFRNEPMDPWQEEYRVPIVSTAIDGTVYELISRSATSKNAIRALIDRYGRHPQRRKGMLPLIKLIDSTYFNRKLGADKPKPVYQIVGWVDGDDPVTKPATPELPFNDSVPF